jgi:AcrR family transcriptional regulator
MTPQRLTAAARRQAILDAAVIEFAEHGLHGTAVESVARRAGVSQPYVFRLFGTKKALFLATVDRVLDRVVTAFRDAARDAERSGGDPLTAMGLAYVALLTDRASLLVHMQAFAACADPEVQAEVRRRFAEVARIVRSLPGATDQTVHDFMAKGMLLNVVAAMDLTAIVDDEDWARVFLGAPPETPPAQPQIRC